MMSWGSTAREVGYNLGGDQGEIPRHSNVSWTARQEDQLDGEPYQVELEHCSTPFIEWYNQTVGIDPCHVAPVGRFESPQGIQDLRGFPLNSDASTLVSSDAATSGAMSSFRDRAYNVPEDLLSWLHGSQSDVYGAGSALNAHYIYHAPALSASRYSELQLVELESFNLYGRLEEPDAFAEPSNKWVSSASLDFSPRGQPQVSKAARVYTSGGDHQGATAEQNEMLWQIDGTFPDPPVPSFADLLELEDPRHGTKLYKGSADHAKSTQKIWLREMTPDDRLDPEYHTAVNQEVSRLSRDISKTTRNDTPSKSINEVAPSLAPVACKVMSIKTRQPSAINADLTLTIGTGKTATSRVRKALPKDRRQEFGVTRQSRSCFRCKAARRVCLRPDLVHGICARCLEVKPPQSQICFKVDISDCGFFRSESSLHLEPLRNEFKWVTSMTITLEIRMAPSHLSEPLRLASEPLRIACRQFRPEKNDITAKFVRGSVQGEMVEVPTYAAVDPRALQVDLEKLVRQYGYIFLHELAATCSSEIVKRTFQEAFRYAAQNPQSLVKKALDLWAGSKLCQFERSLDGSETLGLKAVRDPASPMYNKIPIPPVLDYQCDTVIIQWMKDLGGQLIALLCHKVCARKREYWFEVFLTGFILINNIEYVYGIQKKLVQMYSITTDELSSRTQRVSERMMEQWKWSAQHLLDICKKLFNSLEFFSKRYAKSVADIAGLDPSQVAYFSFLTEPKEAVPAGRRSAPEAGDFNYEMVWGAELLETMRFVRRQPTSKSEEGR